MQRAEGVAREIRSQEYVAWDSQLTRKISRQRKEGREKQSCPGRG